MVTLDLFIAHLENLRDYCNRGDISVTVPMIDTENSENIIFHPIDELKDVHVFTVDIKGKEHTFLYIDVNGLIEIEPSSK